MRTVNCILLVVGIATSTSAVPQADVSHGQADLHAHYTIWQDDTQADSTRADAYVNYIREGFLNNDPDSAFSLAEKLIAFGWKEQYPKAQALGYSIQGASLRNTGNSAQALEYLQRSLELYEEAGDEKGTAKLLSTIGSTYLNLGNYPRTLDYYQRSLRICEGLGDSTGVATSLSAIGSIYQDQGNYSKALEYFTHSLRLLEVEGASIELANTLSRVGSNYRVQGNFTEALNRYQQSLMVWEEIKNEAGVANVLNNIGDMYLRKGDYPAD